MSISFMRPFAFMAQTVKCGEKGNFLELVYICIFPGAWASQDVLVVQNPPANAGDIRDTGLIPGSGRSPGEGNGNLLQLPGEFHGQGSLMNYSPQGHKELDTTEGT